MVEERVEHDGQAAIVRERHAPVGVLAVRPGLILGAQVADGVRERDAGEEGGRGQHRPVDADEDVLVRRVGSPCPRAAWSSVARACTSGTPRRPAPRDQVLHHLRALRSRLGPHLVDGPRQEPQLLPQVHPRPRQVGGGRRDIVRRRGGEDVGALVLRWPQPSVRLALPPDDRRAENPARAEVVRDPRLHRSEVLADHHCPRALRLQAQHGEQRLVVVAHVRAVGGVAARRVLARAAARARVRHPPQSEESEDVVDPERPGVTEGRADDGAEGFVPRLLERAGKERGLGPVLPLLVVHVRRGTDSDP